MYGHANKGFTELPYFRSLIDPYRSEDASGGTRHLDGLPYDALRQLFELLPEGNKEDCQNSAPSIREMLALGTQYPGITYFGYTVVPDRNDERLSIEGFLIPRSDLNVDSVVELAALGPDELGWDGDCLRLWWD